MAELQDQVSFKRTAAEDRLINRIVDRAMAARQHNDCAEPDTAIDWDWAPDAHKDSGTVICKACAADEKAWEAAGKPESWIHTVVKGLDK